LLRVAASHYEPLGALMTQVAVIISTTAPEAKIKLCISFYQVAATLRTVYGLQFDPRFTAWLRFITFNVDWFTQIPPSTCLGSMTTRLVFTLIWPFVTIFIGYIFIYIHALLTRGQNDDSDLKTKLWGRALKFTIIFIYIVLPGLSSSLYDAFLCKSAATNDMDGSRNSYLIADPILRCDDNSDYETIGKLFWALFLIWPVLIPLLMIGLLWKVRRFVRVKRTTPLTAACSFLWRDYNERLFYWEIFDLYRKLFLTGFIYFIKPEEGSSMILRLLVASAVSLLYTGILLRIRPYKHAIDFNLAFAGNIILSLCFIFGIILHFCDGTGEACELYIGRGFDSYNASLLVVLMTASMLTITLVILFIFTVNSINTPLVYVVSTGSKPNLELPEDCTFHAFFSHTWSSGKDKTHTAVRKMQLHSPGMRIWLDADELTHVDQLEQSVHSSAVVLIFYTQGYFRSTNCQREVYAAVGADKPIYLIYESDICDIEGMKKECNKYCTKGENIIDKVFANDPIPWLGSSNSSFANESIKLVSLAILRHLPFYLRIPGQLEKGVQIGNSCNQVKFPSPVDVLVCEYNIGARRIAEELKTHLPQPDNSINILDAKLVLGEASKDSCTIMSGNAKYLLLYLDEDVFLDDDKEVSQLVRIALEMSVKVLTVHELDYTRGACEFGNFFSQTPEDLIDVLYKDIAVPLYPLPEYRRVSFRSLLTQMGAIKTGKRSLSLLNF